VEIVIVGGGRVGTTLAGKLSREGHDVSLIEHRPERAAELSRSLDVRVVEGNGATAGALRAAGAEEASLVVACTESDEVNFVTGRIAAAMFKVRSVVVRLRETEHQEAFAHLSRGDRVEIACVSPEAAAVEKIVSLFEVPGALDVNDFMGGALRVAGFPIRAGSEFAERPVLDMRLFFAETPSLVVAIQRGDRVIVPHGGEVLRAGDIAYFALARSDLENFLELIEARANASHKVLVAGATHLGLTLARRLEQMEFAVTLLEPDTALAQRAAEELPGALVVSGALPQLLEEEEIETVAAFVAVSPDHEDNLVGCLLAKRMGAARAFALVDNPSLASLIGEIAIDAIISPRLLSIGLTMQHVQGRRVKKVAALFGDRVEVLEAEVVQGAPVTRAPIAALELPRGVLVVAVQRQGALRMPRGEDRATPGDRILLVAETAATAAAAEFIAPG